MPVSTIKNRLHYKKTAIDNYLKENALPAEVEYRYIAQIDDPILREIAIKLKTSQDTLKDLK